MQFGHMTFRVSPPVVSRAVEATLLKCFGRWLERPQGGKWVAVKCWLQPHVPVQAPRVSSASAKELSCGTGRFD